jgi:cobalt transporter subunit CbtA
MKHLLSSALFAGFVAGLLCALLQYVFVEPDILLAERYESGELAHFQGVGEHSHGMTGMDMAAEPNGHEHQHDAADASPTQRHALTVLFAILTYCGYALVMIALIQLAEGVGNTLGTAQGLLWGLAGFMAFQMLPAMGLAPELPGTPAADLQDRQVWWTVTAITTAGGLWFLAYGTAFWQRVLGAGALSLPHIWGAPKADGFGGIVPPELASAFAAHSLGVGMITWMALGALVVFFWHSERAT